MKNITIMFVKKLFFLCLFMLSLKGFAQNFTVSLANGSAPTASTFEVDIILTVNAPVAGVRLAGVSTGINFDVSILNGGTPCTTAGCGTWTYVGGKSPAIAALLATNNTYRAPTGSATWGHLRTVMSNLASTSAIDIPTGTYTLGRYRFTNTVPFATGSNANLWLNPVNNNPTGSTNTIVSFYPFGAVTPLSAYTTTAPAAGAGLTLSHTSAATYSLPLGVSVCFTSGTYTQTPVTCFGGSDGTATVTMDPTPTNLAATYVLDGNPSVPVTLTAGGAFTITGLTAGAHTLSVTGSGSCSTAVSVPFTVDGPAGPLTNTTTINACNSYTWSVTGATYTASGTQTGTTVNGSGCTVNETLNLTIEPAPVTTPYSVCQGGTVTGGLISTLSAGGALPNYSGDTTGGPTYNRAVTMVQGGTCTNSGVGTAVNYTTHSFVAPASGAYVFSMCGNAIFDSFLSLYQDPFNPAGLCAGNTLVTASDDFCGAQSQVSATLVQGTAYTLVVSGFGNGDAGPYTVTSTSPVAPPSVEWYTAPTLGTAIGTGSPFNPVGVAGSGLADTNTVGSTTFYAQFPGSTCRTPAIFTVSPTTPNTTTVSACDSYTWSVNGTTYTTGGTYTSVTGCNTETLNLTINTTVDTATTITACDSYTWPVNGTTYTSSTNVTVPFPLQSGIFNTLSSWNSTAAANGATVASNPLSGLALSGTAVNVTIGGVAVNMTSGGAGMYVAPTFVGGANANQPLTMTFTPPAYGVGGNYYLTDAADAIITGNLTVTYSDGTVDTAPVTNDTDFFGFFKNTGISSIIIVPVITVPNVNRFVSLKNLRIATAPPCQSRTLNLTITPSTTNGNVTTSICAGDSYTWPANGVTYTTAQTNLTHVVGCNTATLNLTVTPLTTTGSVTTSICAGDSYTWPANGVTYTTAQTGLTVVTGCNTATLNLTINTAPTPTGSASQTFLNSATVASLVVSPAGVIWYPTLLDAQNGTNALVSTTALTNGSTYWAVNVVGGCRSTPFAVLVTITLGNEDFDNLNFSFYPNPTSSILNITYSRIISEILVFNMLGQQVMTKKTNETDVQIDLSSLAEATYFVKVTSEGREKIIKVIKRN